MWCVCKHTFQFYFNCVNIRLNCSASISPSLFSIRNHYIELFLFSWFACQSYIHYHRFNYLKCTTRTQFSSMSHSLGDFLPPLCLAHTHLCMHYVLSIWRKTSNRHAFDTLSYTVARVNTDNEKKTHNRGVCVYTNRILNWKLHSSAAPPIDSLLMTNSRICTHFH